MTDRKETYVVVHSTDDDGTGKDIYAWITAYKDQDGWQPIGLKTPEDFEVPRGKLGAEVRAAGNRHTNNPEVVVEGSNSIYVYVKFDNCQELFDKVLPELSFHYGVGKEYTLPQGN
jgi:hypothetical protein